MNFEEALKKVQDGTATEEEKQFVRSTLDMANEALNKPAIDFQEALDHIGDDTATPEEQAFVRAKLDASLSGDSRMPSAPVKEASKEEVKKARASFKKRYIVIPVCVILTAVLLVGIILSGVFGFAASNAKKNMKYDRNACVEIVRQYAFENQTELFGDGFDFVPTDFRLDEADKHFDYKPGNIGASSYYFEVQLKANKLNGMRRVEVEIECDVDTRSGQTRLIDVDVDVD